jgi:protein-L-isoaspartate(D-aspartate) O-methyltransferase
MSRLAGYSFLISSVVFPGLAAGPQEERFRRERERMVADQIASRDVKEARVLAVMRKVPRHEFVPEESRAYAYADHPLPIGFGQTISQPYIVAYMTELAEPDPEDVVLEVGTGSAYQAAVLAELVKKVYTIEILEQLAGLAARRLERLGYANVEVKHADGYYGWEEHAPYDAIVVTAAAEHIPPPLVAQLKPGGVMIIPVGSRFQVQTLMRVEKKPDGKVTSRDLLPVRFVPLLGKH